MPDDVVLPSRVDLLLSHQGKATVAALRSWVNGLAEDLEGGDGAHALATAVEVLKWADELGLFLKIRVGVGAP